jgi:DNA-binding CsgD family transcriptional regulator
MLKSTKLSAREIEALSWAAQGKTYNDIGIIMGITFGSVKTYLDTARHKLGATNVTQAVALAITYGHIIMTEEAVAKRNSEEQIARRHGEMNVIR